MSNGLIPFNQNTQISPAFRMEIGQFQQDYAQNGEFFGFNAKREHSFYGAQNLDLTMSCPTLILPSQDGRTYLGIDAEPDDLKDFKVRQSGDTLVLVHEGNNNSININSSDGSIHISNISGRVIINGVDVTAKGKSKKQPRVIILAPENGDLRADMSGQSTLLSAISHGSASLDLSGQCKVGVVAKNIKLDTSGQGIVLLNVNGGNLKVDTSGMGKCKAFGEFNDVRAELSGMGSIHTQGIVKGDYKAEANGMGSIHHSGPVYGKKKQRTSGMSSITFD